ncbi:jouberin-like [Ceratina calcarata]|uniref:Jouberin-like n=1 Tax=Ceratina calcarata TaxID=156304 RepID=A0AAJ7N7U5_9HYME|nr:jouberin-like [Ceratina calcarata]
MKKLRSSQNSGWTYDPIEGKTESRGMLSMRKKNNQNETNLRLIGKKSSGHEANFQNSDSDHYSENSISISNTNDNEKLKSIGGKRSTDLSNTASKSMDIVVDIHQKPLDIKEKTTEKKLPSLSSKEFENRKVFSKTNTIRQKRVERPRLLSIKQQNFQQEDVDSLDLIEEFKVSPTNTVKRIETSRNNKTMKNSDQSSVEEKLQSRRQWAAPKEQENDLKKPARKRWSKDTTVIRLPEARSNSWTVASPRSPVIKDLEQSSSKQDTYAFDNAAFDSENEEIMRIETDHNRKDTRIEMKEIGHETSQVELLNFVSSQDSPSNETFKETVITIEDLNESADLFENRDRNETSNRRYSNVSSSKNRESINKRENIVEENGKSISDDSNTVQSLEEITARSEYHSSEGSMNNAGSLISKRSKEHKKYSKGRSVSLTEDESNDFDKSHLSLSGRSVITSDDDFDEKKLRSSSVKTQRSTYTEREPETRQKKEKRRKTRKDLTSTRSPDSVNDDDDSKKKKKKKKSKRVKYISVTIHRTDMLEIDYVTKHPMVKIHIVNAENGKYLKNESGTSTRLQPIITAKFDFKENKSIIPVWEEELVFEHDFDDLLKKDNEQVVILFEIVDLLSFAEASFNYDKFGHEGCWYKVAWAFLKPVGRNNTVHVDKKVRLQLYKPRRNSQKFERFHTCEVYTWWKSNIREKYPSSLFVTVTSIDPPKLEPVFYRQLSLHELSNTRNEMQGSTTRASDTLNFPKWTRLAAQSCKVPNEILFETDTSENGCFYVAFSSDGKYLACSLSEEHDYPIVVYEVEAKKIHVRFSGHKTFIYSLNWSNNDNYLLSVSSDQTARIWDVQNQIVQHIEMMPHPSYVYCGKFDPENASIVATGCYDRIARIWVRDKKLKNRDLSQELEGHEGYVNSMYFQKNSNLLTADSVGVIIIWMLKRGRKLSSRKEWHISRKIKVREIDGVIINTIVLHPLESRLLVHSRNNGLSMLDLATGVVLQKYNELNNQRIQSTACISPCGSLILCGGEDSSLNVWNLETGSLLAKYTFHRNYRAVTCVDYHPYDHVLAFSTFGSPSSVRVLKFNKDVTGEVVGLKIITDVETTVNSGDISMRFLNTSATPEEKSRSIDKNDSEIPKGRNLQSNRSHNSSHLRSTDNTFSDEEKYSNAKMKLKRLNEAGQTLKNRSANRLYNIIEKIDRILSNTSRSSGDIELGRNLGSLQESSEGKTLTSLNEGVGERRWKPRIFSIEDQSNSYLESSTTCSDKHELIECHPLHDRKSTDRNRKKRSRSAKQIRNSNVSVDDLPKTFSDSAANYQKNKVYDEITNSSSDENIVSNFIIDNRKSVDRRHNRFRKNTSNSSDSTGTYIIEKKETGNDGILNSTENCLDVGVKHFGSDSSVRSNATFTFENERPIPKPRRKSKSSLK